MSENGVPRSIPKEMLLIVLSAFVATAIMGYLDAFERLYQFSRAYQMIHFDEISLFLPSFLAMGFVIYSYRKIQELEIEIRKRKEIEKKLVESEKKYRELSITDDLTKLYNARHFSSRLKRELDRVSRYDHELSLLLLDVDDFKRYNDVYGHFEGDAVLAKLGEVIRAELRRTDSAYRYGGEEFTIVLPETGEDSAMKVADRMREEFESVMTASGQKDMAGRTISVGVTQYMPEENAQSLLMRADKAMYVAKDRGKNQVCLLSA